MLISWVVMNLSCRIVCCCSLAELFLLSPKKKKQIDLEILL